MKAIYNNIVNTASLSASSENPSYPLENLQDNLVASKYRTTSELAQGLVISLASSQASYIFIDNHNITAGATIQIQGNNTDVWGAPAFSENITHSSGLITHEFSAGVQTYNFWRLYINDAGNTDGYIEMGLIVLGHYVQFPGMSPDQSIPFSSTSRSTITDAGQVYGDEKPTYREFTVKLRNCTNTHRENINTVWDANKNIYPLMLLIWSDELDFEPPMYCVINQRGLKWKKSDNKNFPWDVTLKFREVL